MQNPSKLPQQLHVTQLGGINERVSPSQLRPGEFSYLEGLYPSKNGLLSRVPGKTILATLPGGTDILSICQTFNPNGDILVQTDSGRFAYTLDELFGRGTVPNLTPGTTPGTNDNEEAMSIAIIVQREVNGQVGGSAQGYLTGTDASSLLNTFYGRRLTDMLVNQSSTVVSFAASTGGSGAASTPGQFVLAPGTYRIEASITYGGATAASVVAGLYNVTNAAFEVQAGTAIPIVSTPQVSAAATENHLVHLIGRFTVSGSNSTYQINHECSTSAQARNLGFNGQSPALFTPNVNGAALTPTYAQIKILKEP